MKISPIQNHIPFKSSQIDDNNVLGYDDTSSQSCRNEIRKWRETYYMPYQSIYEKEPQLTEYQLGLLLKPFMNRPKTVDSETIMSMPIYNVRPVDTQSNCFRGATLVNHPECLPILKKSGIERIIDLVGYKKYEHNAKNIGLEYYSPKFGNFTSTWLWAEPAFQTQNEFLKDELRFLPFEERKSKTVIDAKIKQYNEESKESVDNFVEFIKVLQKGHYYIGCEFGTDRTNAYLLLNEVFNPLAQNKSELKLKDYAGFYEMDYMYELYKKLTPEHKQDLGWTENFDKKVREKLLDR